MAPSRVKNTVLQSAISVVQLNWVFLKHSTKSVNAKTLCRNDIWQLVVTLLTPCTIETPANLLSICSNSHWTSNLQSSVCNPDHMTYCDLICLLCSFE